MVVTTVAYGDLLFGIQNLYYAMRTPMAIIALIVGGVSGAFALHRGIGHAAGKAIGGIAIAALIYGSLSLANSVIQTTSHHSGISVGDYGM